MNIPVEFVRERKFDEQIKLITKSYRRMDELDQAIEWALQHNPKRFKNVQGDYYIWRTQRIAADIPQLVILYQYLEAESKVIFISAHEVKD